MSMCVPGEVVYALLISPVVRCPKRCFGGWMVCALVPSQCKLWPGEFWWCKTVPNLGSLWILAVFWVRT